MRGSSEIDLSNEAKAVHEAFNNPLDTDLFLDLSACVCEATQFL